jgi:hypothetical protein
VLHFRDHLCSYMLLITVIFFAGPSSGVLWCVWLLMWPG